MLTKLESIKAQCSSSGISSRETFMPRLSKCMYLYLLLPVLVTVISLTLPVSPTQASVSIMDDTNHRVTLKAPATRIVSLYGGLTETVCALGLCQRLVGVTKRDNWPPQVRKKTRIGTHMRPNLELIIGLRPDLVLQGSVRPGSQMVVEKLKQLGIPVAIFNPTSFNGLFSEIERISILCGVPSQGKRLVTSMKEKLQSIRDQYPLAKRPRVIFEVSYPNLLVAGQKNIVTDIIRYSGGENPISQRKKLVKYSLEQIILDSPDVYVVQRGPMNHVNVLPQERPNFKAIRAVDQGHVIVVNEFLFSRPGPRSVQAVERLRSYLFKLYPGTLQRLEGNPEGKTKGQGE